MPPSDQEIEVIEIDPRKIEVIEIDLAEQETLVFPRGDEVVLAIGAVFIVMDRARAAEIGARLVSCADRRPFARDPGLQATHEQ